MKKLNISSQLLFLFFFVIMVASCAFSIITLSRIQVIAEDEVYSRLSTYAYLINSNDNEHLPDMNIGFCINGPNGQNYYSPKLNNYVTHEELIEIVDRIKIDNNSKNEPKISFLANGFVKKARIKYIM